MRRRKVSGPFVAVFGVVMMGLIPGAPRAESSAGTLQRAAGSPQIAFARNFAGPGLADIYPTDVASNATHHYVLDSGRFRVVKVARSTGAIVATAGGHRGTGPGQIGDARAIAEDSSGNVYVTDTPSNRVEKWNSTLGYVGQWGSKGTGDGQFDQDYGVTTGPGKGMGGAAAEVVYVTDGASGGRVQKFTLDGKFISKFGSGHLDQPRQLTVDPATHDIYVISARARKIVVFDQNGAVRFSFGGQGTGDGQFSGDPRGIAIYGGLVFVTDANGYRIEAFDKDTGAFRFSFGSKGSENGRFLGPRGISTTPDGRVVVTDLWGFRLEVFSAANGQWLRTLFGKPPPVGGVNSPRGMDVNVSAGRVYVDDWWNQRIQRFDSDGTHPVAWGQRGPAKQPGAINFAWDVAVQPSTGRVFVANRESHQIEVFDSNGNYVTKWSKRGTANGELEFPQGLAFGPGGDLLVSDSGNDRIQRFSIDSGGTGHWLATYGQFGGVSSPPGQFHTPTGISIAADGTIWVADTLNNRIQERLPDGTWKAYARPTGGTVFLVPWGVTVAPDGSIWVADSGKNRVVQMTATGTEVLEFTGPDVGTGAFDAPSDVELLDGGSTILVSDTWNNRIVQLTTGG
jgi:tripartite motif-containing protein 71